MARSKVFVLGRAEVAIPAKMPRQIDEASGPTEKDYIGRLYFIHILNIFTENPVGLMARMVT
jgi:hypothetical protein